MQLCVYTLTVCLISFGALLLFGKKYQFRLYGRSIILSGGRFCGRACRYSEKIKLREWLKARRGDRIDREIYESISFLRNIIALGNGRRVGSDYIIEQLSHREDTLQPVYIKMLRFLRLGKSDDAIRAFSAEAFTPTGIEFGDLLLRWDELDPIELNEILISQQKAIKEAKGTAQRKQDEIVSELLYFPVVLNVFVIFINFIVVGYFMEQQQMLRMLF